MLDNMSLLDLLFHVDAFLMAFIDRYGVLIYILVFAILLLETGVFAPLPGDSLIFASAAFAAAGLLNIWLLVPICFAAGVLGDSLNYYLGHAVGRKIYARAKGRFVNRENIDRARVFYEKHGGKAIIFSRFVPIVRQFTPFVAGIGRMTFRRFMSYNLIGVSAWVSVCSVLGYFFGNIPLVRENFTMAIVAIVVISLLPAFAAYLKGKLRRPVKSD